MTGKRTTAKGHGTKVANEKKKYIGLARVSSREQEREGYSLDTQEQEIRRYVERVGGELVHLWRIAETASRADERKTFQALIAYAVAHAHELAGVVFSKIDRASRNLRDYVELERLESDHGLQFISVTQHFENTPTGRLSRRLLASTAAFQTEQMSVDIQKGQRKRIENGLALGKAPFGYVNLRKDGRSAIEAHPGNAPKIRRAFQLYAWSGLSAEGVIDKLHAEGVAFTDRHPRWQRGHLYRMLTNRVYIGEVKHHGEWHPGKHEALIDRDTWDRVQAFLNNKTYTVIPMTYSRGLVRCGHCGCGVVGERITKKSTGKKYDYYRCAEYVKRAGHPRHRATERELDRQVLELFARLRIDTPEARAWVEAVLRARTQEDRQASRVEVAELTRQLNEVAAQNDRLIDLLLARTIDEAAYNARMAKQRDAEAQLRLRLDVTNKDRAEVADLAVKTFELSQALTAKWVTADHRAKRRVLEILWSNCTFADGKLSYVMRKPFDILVEGLGSDMSGGREDRTHTARRRPALAKRCDKASIRLTSQRPQPTTTPRPGPPRVGRHFRRATPPARRPPSGGRRRRGSGPSTRPSQPEAGRGCRRRPSQATRPTGTPSSHPQPGCQSPHPGRHEPLRHVLVVPPPLVVDPLAEKDPPDDRHRLPSRLDERGAQDVGQFAGHDESHAGRLAGPPPRPEEDSEHGPAGPSGRPEHQRLGRHDRHRHPVGRGAGRQESRGQPADLGHHVGRDRLAGVDPDARPDPARRLTPGESRRRRTLEWVAGDW